MSEEDFAHILCALEGKTEYIYYHLMGEPLSHPLLPRFILMAGNAGFRSVVTTNGTLLSSRGRAILDAGVYKVNVSLHSFESKNTVRTVGDAGPYEGAERGVVGAAPYEEGAMEEYLSGVCDFLDDAQKAGVLCVLRLWNEGYDGGRNARILDFLQGRLSGEWAENTKGYRIRHRLHLEWGERFAWPDMGAPVCSEGVFCHALSDHFGILSDGTVVPCCLDAEGTLALGNLFSSPLDEILSSPRAAAMREGFARREGGEELCLRCGYATRFR
jgi:radical SAM protein with 4Fe4S-binding SPASM domain